MVPPASFSPPPCHGITSVQRQCTNSNSKLSPGSLRTWSLLQHSLLHTVTHVLSPATQPLNMYNFARYAASLLSFSCLSPFLAFSSHPQIGIPADSITQMSLAVSLGSPSHRTSQSCQHLETWDVSGNFAGTWACKGRQCLRANIGAVIIGPACAFLQYYSIAIRSFRRTPDPSSGGHAARMPSPASYRATKSTPNYLFLDDQSRLLMPSAKQTIYCLLLVCFTLGISKRL